MIADASTGSPYVSVTVSDVSQQMKKQPFFFLCNVINFYTMQDLACFSSSCCSPRAQQATDTVPRGSAPTAKRNTYSFGHRQYLWQGWTTTNIFANKQSCHLSIQKEVCSFTGTSGLFGIIIYYQHQLPDHWILIIHVKAHCDNNMHF